MTFKLNVSQNGKTYKLETENEILVGKKIGENISGSEIDENLSGYELEITGSSDLSGIPGFKGLEGSAYHRKLLKYGSGMKDRRKGIRLRKTLRGEEISLKTHQINTKVVKEGSKKFEDLVGKKEALESEDKAEVVEEKPVEQSKGSESEKTSEEKAVEQVAE